LSVERGNSQIDDGIAAIAAALGDSDKVAPFFRFPGFGWTAAGHQHAALRGLMVWGADVPADDWLRLGSREVARRAVQRLERKGKGILLLHDIHQRTVDALPYILSELKARGFRIVHVVAARSDRPATVTAAADWLPKSGPAAPAVPAILIANVQDADEIDFARKTIEELCSLTPSRETTVGRLAHHRHGRRLSHVAMKSGGPGHGKAGTPNLAGAYAVTLRPRDIHAVAQ